ncbi:MAG: hypothetical protein R2865_08215 [Deinococcales bacterium]
MRGPEGEFVASQIERLLAEKAYSYDDIAVLYRTTLNRAVLKMR